MIPSAIDTHRIGTIKQSVQELTASLLIVLSVCGVGAASAGNVVPEQEYAKKIKASERLEPLTSTLFGDSVSLYNGAIAFTQVDIDLPGNNALPVRLVRTMLT